MPTPIKEVTVDFNEMIIYVYENAMVNLISRNFYLTSSMYPVKFTN